MTTDRSRGVAPAWRWASIGLAALLLVSWAFLSYVVLDGAISLDYCRMEQRHLRHDIRVLVGAAAGRLPSSAFLEAEVREDPELVGKGLEEDNTLLLRSATLRFDEDGILEGLLGHSLEEANDDATP